MKYDGTAVEAREKAVAKAPVEEKPKYSRGRPRKGETRPAKEESVLEKQQKQSLVQMLTEMPKGCDIGCKRNSKGYKETWRGYKLHIATADGDIPVAALLSSASMHDSGAILPLMKIAQERVTWLYDLADSAYCSTITCAELVEASAKNRARRSMFR